jgi:hypothetical protein
MVYQSRIPADPLYVQSLGQALYNFTYLEAIVVSAAGRLGRVIPKKATAGQIAQAFDAAIVDTSPPLSPELRDRLTEFSRLFRAAISTRNTLLHARPYTAADGEQQLGYHGHEWTASTVDEAAMQFEMAAIHGTEVYHSSLVAERR